MVQMPPIPPLKRRLLSNQETQDSPTTVGFALKSGRIIRCVNSGMYSSGPVENIFEKEVRW